MTLEFRSSPDPTLGVEVEMQIVEEDTGALACRIYDILDKIPRTLHHRIKPEFLQSTLEINTEVCRDLPSVRRDLEERIALARSAARGMGLDLLCAGTHPVSSWKDQAVTDNPRYRRLLEEFRLWGRRLAICGLHVHVGVDDGDKAVAVLNVLRGYLPHLLALSTSSPFWAGYDTGMYSSRIKIFEILPTAGLPPRLKNWREFGALVKVLMDTRTIESTREIWWEARPHPAFGTLEVRVCDSPSTLDEMLTLTALIQALVVTLCRARDEGMLPEVPLRQLVEENKWQAARHGLDGYFIDYASARTVPIRRAVRDLVTRVRPAAVSLGSDAYLDGVETILERGTSAHRQRALYRRTGDLGAVVRDLRERLVP